MTKEKILRRISELKGIPPDDQNIAVKKAFTVYMSTVSIALQIYGPNSVQLKELKAEKERLTSIKANETVKCQHLIRELHGILDSFKADIEEGLIESLQNEAMGEIYSDFISFSKASLEEGSKDVSAVLACAALEDCLKKYAESEGLNIDEAEMSKVINLLKAQRLVKKPEAKIMQSYVSLRNKAFHAEWDKIGIPEVSSVIGFVEGFILSRFCGDKENVKDNG